MGTALLASLLSAGLAAMPRVAGDVPAKMSRELRVSAMADAGDVLAEVLMGPLRQVIGLYLRDPSEMEIGGVRVVADAPAANDSEVVEPEVVETRKVQRA